MSGAEKQQKKRREVCEGSVELDLRLSRAPAAGLALVKVGNNVINLAR